MTNKNESKKSYVVEIKDGGTVRYVSAISADTFSSKVRYMSTQNLQDALIFTDENAHKHIDCRSEEKFSIKEITTNITLKK